MNITEYLPPVSIARIHISSSPHITYILVVALRALRDGQLVPSSTMVALLKEAILKGDAKRFLLDGFPRSQDNLEAWFDAFSDEEIQV